MFNSAKKNFRFAILFSIFNFENFFQNLAPKSTKKKEKFEGLLLEKRTEQKKKFFVFSFFLRFQKMRSKQKKEDALRFENTPENREKNVAFQECAGFGVFWTDFCSFKDLTSHDWDEAPRQFMVLSEEFRLIFQHCFAPKGLTVCMFFISENFLKDFFFFFAPSVQLR